MNVFGAGISETGTTSLQEAFTLLAFKTPGFNADRLDDAVIPAEGLSATNIVAGDGWDKVFEFIGMDKPNTPFPYKNRARNAVDQIQESS